MKVIKFLVCCLIIVFVVSCKKEKETDNETQKQVNVFKITLNATISKDDHFQIFYKESNDKTSPFEEKYSLFTDVKGGEQPQDIVFNLPEDVFPMQLRFDFGTNKEQPDILVNKFKIEYNGKTFEANGSNFFDYLIADEGFVKVDRSSSKATPFVTKDGVYDPMFYSSDAMYHEIIKLAK